MPVLVLTLSGTAIHHYFRKRKNARKSIDDNELATLASPENNSKAYLYLDHSGILRQYQDKLSYSHARYVVLKKDFESIEYKYLTLKDQLSTAKTNQMENNNPQFTPGEIAPEINVLEPIAEQFYLKDLVEEKKAQIEFLQSQLEQRIRKQHEAEQSLLEKDREFNEKQNQIAYADGQVKELREQNELLNAALADRKEKASILQQQIEDEQSKTKAMEHRMIANKQLLQRFYKEFSACMDEQDASVVVPMHPTYGNSVEM